MNNIINLDENRKEKTTPLAIPSPLIGGGDDDGRGWLGRMVIGTCFLTRNPQDVAGVDLLQFQIVHHADKSTLLMQQLPDGNVFARRVDTSRFSNRFTYFETLGVVLPQEKEEEQKDQ